jgi:RNA polymerase primary sigma factor
MRKQRTAARIAQRRSTVVLVRGTGSASQSPAQKRINATRKAVRRLFSRAELPENSESGERQASGEERNAYTLYLREIGQTKLLTPAEEIQLAKRIKKGDAKARQEMIKANLRLVVKIAREYENYGVPLLDLINEGNIGLMKAIERFDPKKGNKLSTYAAWWIKQRIRTALSNQARTIRLPMHVIARLMRLRRAAMQLEKELGREASDEELAEKLDITPSQVADLRRAAISMSSLDAPLTDEEDSGSFADVIEDEFAETPYELLERKTDAQTLRELLSEMPKREAAILRLRFGVNGGEKKPLEEIGRKFGVTRERIRQIQNAALKRMRQMIASRETTRLAA